MTGMPAEGACQQRSGLVSSRLPIRTTALPHQQPPWQPGAERIPASHLARFCRQLGRPVDMAALHAWSVAEPEAFWRAISSLPGIIGDGPGKTGIANPGKMPGAQFFPEARLN